MASYKVVYYRVSEESGLPEDHPREIICFQRPRLSRRDVSTMLLFCTDADCEVLGYVYRDDEHIGMVAVRMTDLYKATSVFLSKKYWFKNQWFRRAA